MQKPQTAEGRRPHSAPGNMEQKSPPTAPAKGFGIWPCELCPEVFETEDARASHRKTHVKFGIQTFKYGKETYIYDKDIYGDSNYTKQAPRKTEEPYSCLVCGQGFSMAIDLLHHRSTHVDGKTCQICGKKTSSPKEYKEHMRRHRMQKPSLKYTPNKPQQRREGELIYEHWTDMFHKAAEYPLKSASPIVSEAHSTGSEPNVLPIDETSQFRIKPRVTPEGEVADRERVPGGKFRFSGSDTDTLGLQSGVKHLKRDTLSDSPHIPSTTNKLPQDQHLERRPQPEQGEDLNKKAKQYQCIYCPIKFVLAGSLRKHMELHTGQTPWFSSTGLSKKEKPHQCLYCLMRFAQEVSLKKHLELHTREKPHQCEDCSAGFATLNELQAHEKTTHAKVSTTTCSLCGVKFDSTLMNYHMALHNAYVCPKCPDMFDSEETLQDHMQSHQPKEIFTCVVCAKTYPTFTLLESHLEVHRVPYKPNHNNETDCIDLSVDEPTTDGAGENGHFSTNTGNIDLSVNELITIAVDKSGHFSINTGNEFRGDQNGTESVQDVRGEPAFRANAQGETAFGTNVQGETAFGTNVKGGTAFGTNVQAETAFGANVQGETAFGANVKGETAFSGIVQGETTFGGNVQTAFGANVKGETTFSANVQGETAFSTNVQGETTFGANVQTAVGANVKVETAFSANVQGETAFGTNVKVETAFSANVQGETAFGTNVQGETAFGTNARQDLQSEQFGTGEGEEVVELDCRTLRGMPPTNEKPFSCSFCPIKYGSSDRLSKHLRMVHGGKSAFICSECGIGFISEVDLNVHMQFDTQRKPYACSICKKRCISLLLLKHHARNHRGKNRPKCQHCNKTCGSKAKLNEHIKREHCDPESYSFSNPISVNRQRKIFACSICKKRCTSISNLKQHMENHRDLVERFPCEHCAKVFTSNIELSDHRREHCYLDSYKCSEPVSIDRSAIVDMSMVYSSCELCIRGFGNPDELRIHMIQHLTTIYCHEPIINKT